MKPSLPDSDDLRRRAVAWAVALTANTPLAPQRYERQLLARYQQGELSIDQVIELLDTSLYRVLYRSRATPPPQPHQLAELLDWSQGYNAAHNITGLLLYSDGLFVQVLEGPEAAVRALYANIQADSRHTRVVTVSAGPAETRLFADWSMAYGRVTAPEVAQVLAAVQAQVPALNPPVSDPHLRVLLEAFGCADALG